MYVIPIHYKAVSGMCEKDLAHPVAIVLALFQALMCGRRKRAWYTLFTLVYQARESHPPEKRRVREGLA